MPDIAIDRTLDAPIDKVFEAMSDHARYDRFRSITKSALLREGDGDPNGNGAVRSLRAGVARFDEEISAFDRPNRFDYLIVKTNLPLRHEHGSVRFEPAGSGTRVLWTSTFHITVPLLARPLGALMTRQLNTKFNEMLEDAAAIANA